MSHTPTEPFTSPVEHNQCLSKVSKTRLQIREFLFKQTLCTCCDRVSEISKVFSLSHERTRLFEEKGAWRFPVSRHEMGIKEIRHPPLYSIWRSKVGVQLKFEIPHVLTLDVFTVSVSSYRIWTSVHVSPVNIASIIFSTECLLHEVL